MLTHDVVTVVYFLLSNDVGGEHEKNAIFKLLLKSCFVFSCSVFLVAKKSSVIMFFLFFVQTVVELSFAVT